MISDRSRVVIIGSGISGTMAAYLISQNHDVVLIEKEDRTGGHTNTFTIATGPDAGTPVDTGFIVLNDRTYPVLHKFFEKLGVAVRYSDMSFGFYCEASGLQYAAPKLRSLFAQRGNIFSADHIGMIWELHRFNKLGREALSGDEADNTETLQDFVERHSLSDYFVSNYLIPMAAAIWSSPDDGIRDFPIRIFLQFFFNHGLLHLFDRPRWQTVVGGSKTYLERFKETFNGRCLVGSGAQRVERNEQGCVITLHDSEQLEADYVVLAAHADESLRLLGDADETETELLGAWDYQKNHTVLHTDTSFLPPLTDAHASWNYRREAEGSGKKPLSITYDMNRLQGLNTQNRYLVTLNGTRAPRADTVHYEITYDHPIFTRASVATQQKIRERNGKRRTFFCGAYLGFGFHEDGAKAGYEVGRQFGGEL